MCGRCVKPHRLNAFNPFCLQYKLLHLLFRAYAGLVVVSQNYVVRTVLILVRNVIFKTKHSCVLIYYLLFRVGRVIVLRFLTSGPDPLSSTLWVNNFSLICVFQSTSRRHGKPQSEYAVCL